MWSVILLIPQIVFVGALIVGLYQKNTNSICKSKKRLDGKTVLVTGGTSGMGLEIATDFAQRGAKVIVACPFEDEGYSGKKKIIENSENENVIFKLLDLSNLASVREFAADVLKTVDRLDILVNNAGVGSDGDRITKDGMNFIMQVNYFGSFLLTILLLPLLKKTGTSDEPSRIVNTASVLHRIGCLNFNHWNEPQKNFPAYANSKLCVILFTRELAKRLENSNVVVNAVDPGAVGTDIFKASYANIFSSFGVVLSFILFTLFKQPWEGAQTAIYAALSRSAGKANGELFKNCKMTRPSRKCYNEKLAKNLWEESAKLVKLNESTLST
ncbi:retinol dehydrogenase 13-like [Plodia interpunctella]|uniref:retinol dehydrogenase 13-like n=1 Tax=Plodia interpunctella TaxID=58824 RepID=UPI0023688CED|nr:retinol dehydrogenase 13-like [Plodia interpunctella]